MPIEADPGPPRRDRARLRRADDEHPRHPSLDRAAGALTISGAGRAQAERRRIAEVLRGLGR
jgi:hypothetical protein